MRQTKNGDNVAEVSTRIEVVGLKDALKTLNKIDKSLRREITKDAKQIVQPVINDAKAAYPAQLLSGMNRNWTQGKNQKFPYNQKKAQQGLTVKVSTKKSNTSVITITQKNPAAAIIDMAGKKGGSNERGKRFIAALTLQFGYPSRVLWPAYERNAGEVQRNMVELVKRIMSEANRETM
jgi:hypothetical protein